MSPVNCVDDLIDELDMLRAYGVSVSDAAYAHARQVDLRLYALLDRREAALLVMRRASSAAAPTSSSASASAYSAGR